MVFFVLNNKHMFPFFFFSVIDIIDVEMIYLSKKKKKKNYKKKILKKKRKKNNIIYLILTTIKKIFYKNIDLCIIFYQIFNQFYLTYSKNFLIDKLLTYTCEMLFFCINKIKILK
jgi:hypothetical protein